MKTLIAYNVIASAIDRFNFVQGFQQRFFPHIDQYDRLIVSDKSLDVPGFTCVVCERFNQPNGICVSAARNTGIEYSDKNGYDAVLLADIDSVILEPIKQVDGDWRRETVFASTQAEVESWHFTMSEEWPPIIILSRSAFYLRWNEEYVGYGCEDVDFNVCQLRSHKCVEDRNSRTNTLHIWHPIRQPRVRAWENKVILARNLAKHFYTGWPDMRRDFRDDPELIGMVSAYVEMNKIEGVGETGKANARREREGFFEKYTQGQGIDIGSNVYPVFPNARRWDREDGDATFMAGVPDNSFDYVYSSHCLEDSVDPIVSLKNWYRILKPIGYLIVAVPHRDLFEKRLDLPSVFNAGGHKWFWVVGLDGRPPTRGLTQTILTALPGCRLESIRITDENYYAGSCPAAPPHGEYSIEAIVRKMP